VSVLRPLADGTMVTSGRLGIARVDPGTGAPSWTVTAEFDRCVNLTVVEERGVLFCGDPYGRLEERDLETGVVVGRLDAQNGNSGSLWVAAAGTELVSFGNNEPVVSRWRLDRSGPITRVVAPGWTPIDFDPTGNLLVVERGDPFAGTHEAALVDLEDGTMVALDMYVIGWTGPDSLLGIAQSPSGSFEFARLELDDGRPAGGPVTGGVVVEPLLEIADLRLDTGKDRVLFRYQFSSESSLAALDAASHAYGPTIPIDGIVSWAIDRTGDRIVSGTSSGVVVYDGDTGELLDTLADTALRAIFVTAADQLFVGSLGGELTQYDLTTLEPVRTFGGSRGLVLGGTGTADGSVIAITGGDRVVSVFDVASGVRLGGPISIGPDERNRVTLSLDGRWLAVGGQPNTNDGPQPIDVGDHPTQLWDLDPEHWEQAACRVAGRNLTPAEWTEHIGDLAPYRPTCN
jgi:hypothetical protein